MKKKKIKNGYFQSFVKFRSHFIELSAQWVHGVIQFIASWIYGLIGYIDYVYTEPNFSKEMSMKFHEILIFVFPFPTLSHSVKSIVQNF